MIRNMINEGFYRNLSSLAKVKRVIQVYRSIKRISLEFNSPKSFNLAEDLGGLNSISKILYDMYILVVTPTYRYSKINDGSL